MSGQNYRVQGASTTSGEFNMSDNYAGGPMSSVLQQIPRSIPTWNNRAPLKTGIRPAPGWSTSLPRSVKESNSRAINTSSGQSHTNNTATFPFVVIPESKADAEELIQTRMMFTGRYSKSTAAQPIKTIQQMNRLLRHRCIIAQKIITSGLQGNGIVRGYNKEKLIELLRTPTSEWFKDPDFRVAVASSRQMSYLLYLCPEWLVETFNMIGFMLNDLGDNKEKISITISRHGYIERCENIFGSNAHPTNKLYITLCMFENPRTHERYLQYVPHAEIDIPLLSSKLYEDFTGMMRGGYCWYIGDVLRPVSDPLYSSLKKSIRDEDAGLVELDRRVQSYLHPAGSAFVSTYRFRKGTHLHLMC